MFRFHSSRLTARDLQLATYSSRLTARDLQLATYSSRLTAHDLQLTTYSSRLTAHDLQLTTYSSRLTAYDLQGGVALFSISGEVLNPTDLSGLPPLVSGWEDAVGSDCNRK